MAISNDWTNKSLKIQQETEKAEAYQAGVNQGMKIAQHASPYIPQERPREGVGGTNEHPFDDFGNDRNNPIINPATGKPEWAGTNKGMTIAHQGQHYGLHGQPIQDPAKGMLPSGKLIHMKHMEQSPEEHKRNKEMHIKNYGQQARATSRQIRDKLKPYTKGGPADYDKEGGSLRNLPASLRIQLLKV